jgi:hypothetical protein
VLVVFEDGFGLCQRRAREKRRADPVVDEPAGYRNFLAGIEGV